MNKARLWKLIDFGSIQAREPEDIRWIFLSSHGLTPFLDQFLYVHMPRELLLLKVYSIPKANESVFRWM